MQITVQKSGQVVTQINVERGPVLIGSDPSVTVQLPMPSIPKRQAMLLQDAKGYWFLEDLASGSRTLLNGRPARRARLRRGDRIDIGPFRIIIQAGQLEAPGAAGKAAPKLVELPESAVVRYPEDSIAIRAVTINNTLQATAGLFLVTDQQQMLKEVLDVLMAIFGAANAWIGLRTDMSAPIAISSGRSESGQTIDDRSLPPALIERALAHDHAVLIPRMADFSRRGTRIRIVSRVGSAMTCPVQTSRGTIGVIYIDNTVGSPAYTEVDLDQLIFVAGQVGVAINRMVSEWAIRRQQPNRLVGSAEQVAALLKPAALPAMARCAVVAAAYPGRGEGIDCHDIKSVSENVVTALLANTARHDGQALTALSRLRGAFSIWSGTELSPAELLRQINRDFIASNDPCSVSAMVARVYLGTGRLELANAGSQPAFVLSKAGKLEVLAAQGVVPIGLDALSEFSNCSLNLEPGQTIILWTKGIITARDTQRREYGRDRFAQSVEENFGRSASDMLRDIWQDLRDFMGKVPQRNPITLMVIQPNLGI